jgi:hypothetical protein
MKLLQNLSVENLKHVEHFIKSLDAKDTPKPTPHFVKEPLPDLSQQSITPPKILSLGLSYVGFSIRRQASVREELNNRRFISFYGAPPQALAPLFRDVRDMFRQERPTCEDLFMTCNWLKCYDVMHVLEGRWGYCEDYMRPRIIRCQQMMQALRRQKMKFVQSATLITASLDTVTFTVQEFRNDPGSKWYDPKSKSAGLVSNVYLIFLRNARDDFISSFHFLMFLFQKKYEFCVCTDEPGKQVWLRGPFPPGEFPDITIFRGGDEKTAMKDRDKCALYFEMPQDKKFAADSAYAGEYDRIVLTMPEMKKEEIKWLNRLKARGETLHGRLKSFRVLGTRFRHGTGTEDKMNRHQMATESVCLIVLYDCENGRPLFDQ